MDELVSVIIPTYNRRGIISRTIDSVLNQTYRNWECIIVDDHSTDGTNEIISQIRFREKRIRYVINNRSKGAQGARNTGIKEATGKWIAFLDSDDEWLPGKLKQQMKILADRDFDPYTMVHGNCLFNDHELGTEILWNLSKTEGEKPFNLLLQRASPVFPSILTSKKALEDVGYLDENVPSYQEWDTALLLSKLCGFVHIEEPLFIYHLHSGETMSKDKKQDIAGHHYILMKYRKDIIEQFDKQFFTNALLSNIKRIVDFKEWEFGVELLKEAQPYIPLKSRLYYTACFRFQVNPDSIRQKNL